MKGLIRRGEIFFHKEKTGEVESNTVAVRFPDSMGSKGLLDIGDASEPDYHYMVEFVLSSGGYYSSLFGSEITVYFNTISEDDFIGTWKEDGVNYFIRIVLD